MRELLTTRQFHVRYDANRRLVVLYRTTDAFESSAAVDTCFTAMEKAVAHLRRETLVLLADARDGPVRNDPEFERAFARNRQRLFAGFSRIAVVTRTAIGAMQVARHARADSSGAQPFTSVEEALEYLGVRGGGIT